MDVLRLDVQQSMARLDLQAQNAQLSTSMRSASVEVTKEPGRMTIEASHPQLSIDATTAKSEEGHATTAELVSQFADQGQQAAQTAARQYNEMGRVYRAQLRNKNAIVRHALDQAVPAMPMYTIAFVPSAPPQVSFTDNTLSYAYQPPVLHVNWNTYQNAAISTDRPAQLSIWMAQQPELHFSVQA
ncbi:DUF6470 family protein [Ethanoligenens sp.]|uniref:DUF6470 family protein n=1 Tax=Ethanoligenens sp. TaxID=2099655 RepID=UPI0039E891E4